MANIVKSDNFDGNYKGDTQYVKLWCEASVAIVAGDWLAVSATDTSNPGGIAGETYIAADATGTTDNSNFDVVGVATEALASGTGWVTAQVAGRRTMVNCDTNVDAGDPLCVGTTKGQAIEQVFDAATTANRRTIGRAVTAAVDNGASADPRYTSTVDIYRHPKFAH